MDHSDTLRENQFFLRTITDQITRDVRKKPEVLRGIRAVKDRLGHFGTIQGGLDTLLVPVGTIRRIKIWLVVL